MTQIRFDGRRLENLPLSPAPPDSRVRRPIYAIEARCPREAQPAEAGYGRDDAAHHDRKALLLDVLGAEAVDRLGVAADARWAERVRGWAARPEVRVFDEAVDVLAAAVLPWAGIEVAPEEQHRRSRQLAAATWTPVSGQDLSWSTARMPTRPRSGVRLAPGAGPGDEQRG